MAIAWSMADPELLLSCGKDAKILMLQPALQERYGEEIFLRLGVIVIFNSS